jgi:hypothetical protein
MMRRGVCLEGAMDDERDLTTADRVLHLLRHLNIGRAHFVMGTEVAAAYPEVVASLALVTPMSAEAPRCVSWQPGVPSPTRRSSSTAMTGRWPAARR